MRAWCAREFAEHGLHFVPVQANMGFSVQKGTIRGMHYQTAPAPEAKLVRCTRGAIFDVALDLRPNSPNVQEMVRHRVDRGKRPNAVCARELCSWVPDA